MTRIIDQQRPEVQEFNQLARMEEVNEEELQKRFLKEVSDIDATSMSPEEVRKEKEKEEAVAMMDFLGITDEMNLDLDNDPLEQISQMCTDVYREELKAQKENPEYQEKIREINKEMGVEEIDSNQDFTNKDDPYLAKEFEREKAKISALMKARRERSSTAGALTMKEREAIIEQERKIEEEFDAKITFDNFDTDSIFGKSTTRSSSIFGNSTKSSSDNYRATSSTSETTSYSSDKTEFNRKGREEAQKGRNKFVSAVVGGLLDMIYGGKMKEKEAPKSRHFSGSKRFSFKGMWTKTKGVFKSKETALWVKVGAMVALQAGMAVLSNNLEFDGPLQGMGYIGMALGAGYIARELRAAGFDARRINFM